MNEGIIVDLFRDAVTTVIMVAAPMLLIALVVGLVIAIFQATTQINEQTMVFVPKVVAVLVSLVIFGPWILRNLHDYAIKLFDGILTLI